MFLFITDYYLNLEIMYELLLSIQLVKSTVLTL